MALWYDTHRSRVRGSFRVAGHRVIRNLAPFASLGIAPDGTPVRPGPREKNRIARACARLYENKLRELVAEEKRSPRATHRRSKDAARRSGKRRGPLGISFGGCSAMPSELIS